MYYQRGTVATTEPWGAPTRDKIQHWAWAMLPLILSCQLQAWVTGRSVYQIESARDLDIVYTGPVTDFTQLALLLNASVAQGFAEHMLVDCKWAESAETTQGTAPGDVNFIWTDYYAYSDGQGPQAVRDYQTRPGFEVIAPGLVQGNFRRLNGSLRPHQLAYIDLHGALPCVELEQFLKEPT